MINVVFNSDFGYVRLTPKFVNEARKAYGSKIVTERTPSYCPCCGTRQKDLVRKREVWELNLELEEKMKARVRYLFCAMENLSLDSLAELEQL